MASSRYAAADSALKTPSKTLSMPHPPAGARPTAALARTRSDGHGLGAMVKKFIEKRSNLKPGKAERIALPVPADAVAGAKGKGSNITSLHRKLFNKGGSADRTTGKALMEAKSNTRTLAAVLRSERELLGQNKECEAEISELRLSLEERNREMEKLKDLCLKQREEIKALKDALLFPDTMNSQLKELLERQGSELKQAKEIIPGLLKQVSSLTGQLEWLKEDVAEVKADKYSARTCFDGPVSSPRTPIFDHEFANSLEYSSGDPITRGFGSPDDMILKDLNPCLTPCFAKNKSKEFDNDTWASSDSPNKDGSFQRNRSPDMSLRSRGGMTFRSSEGCERPSSGSNTVRKIYRSDESKLSAGKPRPHNLFRI